MPNEFEAAANMLAVDREAAAAAERKRIEDEAARQARAAETAAKAKAAAEARWPEIWALLNRAVEAYNAKIAATGVSLTLAEEATMQAWLKPYRLTISSNKRSIEIVFSIGQGNLLGYQLRETLQYQGQRSAVPPGMSDRAEVQDVASLVKQLVDSVAKAP